MGIEDWEDRENQSFENLEFYQDSLKLLQAAYRLAEDLPDRDRYNSSNQLRRSTCSLLLNLAEAYKLFHYLDRLRFYCLWFPC